MEFTKESANEIAALAHQAVVEALSDRGITVERGGGSYSPLTFDLKLKLTTQSDNGETQAQRDYRRAARKAGWPLEMLGATVTIAGNLYEVTGYLPRKRKNNIQVLRLSDGRTQIAPLATVLLAFNKSRPIPATKRDTHCSESGLHTLTCGGKKKATSKKKAPQTNGVLGQHPFGGECNEGCKPDIGLHVIFDGAEIQDIAIGKEN